MNFVRPSGDGAISGPFSTSIASGSSDFNGTNAGWTIYPITSSTTSQPFGAVASSASYDPNNIGVAGSRSVSGSLGYSMMRLQNPTTGIMPNQAFTVQHDARSCFNGGLTSGSFNTEKDVELMIVIPTQLPSGTYAYMMATDVHISGTVTGYGVAVRSEAGTGLRVGVIRNVAGTYTLTNATADATAFRAAKFDVNWQSSTTTRGISVTPLNAAGAATTVTAQFATDTGTASGGAKPYIHCGFGWISGTVGQTASVTASFRSFIAEPNMLRSGSFTF